MRSHTLLTFPCEFTLKVMGKHHHEFKERLIQALLLEFNESILLEQLASKLSANHKFISINLVVQVESQDKLDTIYRFVTSFDDVVFVL